LNRSLDGIVFLKKGSQKMSPRRHGKTAYPFSEGAAGKYAVGGTALQSNDRWVKYWLTPDGWEYRKESSSGGVTSEGGLLR
jgi:hypothetical protein